MSLNIRKLLPSGVRGFTLIEIAVVLAIVGMVLMLVIPRLPSSESENLKVSARTLASVLRYVQERAAATQTRYFLRLEPEKDGISVRESTADGGEKETASVAFPGCGGWRVDAARRKG